MRWLESILSKSGEPSAWLGQLSGWATSRVGVLGRVQVCCSRAKFTRLLIPPKMLVLRMRKWLPEHDATDGFRRLSFRGQRVLRC